MPIEALHGPCLGVWVGLHAVIQVAAQEDQAAGAALAFFGVEAGGGAFDLLLQDELFLAAELLQFRFALGETFLQRRAHLRVLLRKTLCDGKGKGSAWPSFTWT